MKNDSSYCTPQDLREAASFLLKHSASIKDEVVFINDKINEISFRRDSRLLQGKNEGCIDFGIVCHILKQIENIAKQWEEAAKDIEYNQILTPPTRKYNDVLK